MKEKPSEVSVISNITVICDGAYQVVRLVGSSYEGHVKSIILDAKPGTLLGSFQGGRLGFAISPDGKQMVLGNLRTVEIFSIQ